LGGGGGFRGEKNDSWIGDLKIERGEGRRTALYRIVKAGTAAGRKEEDSGKEGFGSKVREA